MGVTIWFVRLVLHPIGQPRHVTIGGRSGMLGILTSVPGGTVTGEYGEVGLVRVPGRLILLLLKALFPGIVSRRLPQGPKQKIENL